MRLLHNVIGDPAFKPDDLRGVDFKKLKKDVADYRFSQLCPQDGWKESSVTISVSLGKPRRNKEKDHARAIDIPVPGLHFRSITNLVKRIYASDPLAASFHIFPFRQYATLSPSSSPARLLSEVFSSDAMIEEHERLQLLPRVEGNMLERVIVALQFWSDATLLSNFGSAKLWLFYMCIGNQLMAYRLSPSTNSVHDVTFIPSVCSHLLCPTKALI